VTAKCFGLTHFAFQYNWRLFQDAWVPEDNIYILNDKSRAYAARVVAEHRQLRNEMSRKVKGKKQFQTVDGTEFAKAWSKKRLQLDREMDMLPSKAPRKSQSTVADVEDIMIQDSLSHSSAEKKPRADTWNRRILDAEVKLRAKSLTRKLNSTSNNIALPSTLKKILVEQWEIITQCDMIISLPATVTIRQALNSYLESKGVPADSVSEPGSNSPSQPWIEMADGIALLFDQALPLRLLYRTEFPQLVVKEGDPEFCSIRPSDFYGCEHLLRLFTRLPDLMEDGIGEAQSRSIFAKVNDLIRFLHKNHETMFVQSYRKMNDAETKEKVKLLKVEERHKRKAEAAAATAAAAAAAATDILPAAGSAVLEL